VVLALLLDPLVWQVWSHRYLPGACVLLPPTRENALVDGYARAASALEIGAVVAAALTVALVAGIRRSARVRGGQTRLAATP